MDTQVIELLSDIKQILEQILLFNISFFVYGVAKIVKGWFSSFLNY